MVVLRVLLRTLGVFALAGRGLVRGGASTGRLLGRGVRGARQRGGGGETGMIRLLDLHAASCAGDTLIAIGLAGTIFFTVPVGEARGRVALYLLVTMLPFAVLAPVVGPVLDRFRHGRRYALATTFLGRAFLAYLISENMGGLALYPAAFGILVLSRAYGVARSAAVPRVLPHGLGLSEAGARAAVFGTMAGALVVPFGVLAATTLGPEWSLRLSLLIFAYGMITALRLPPRADSDPAETIPRPLQKRGRKGAKVLSGPLIWSALAGSASLRALYGFLTLFLAFSIRSDAVDTDMFGVRLGQATALGLVAGALGIGTFLAVAAGTTLRIRRPLLLQAGGITIATVAAVVASIRYAMPWVVLLCLLTAVASGLAKLAVDAVIQERTDDKNRASAFAHSETLLMIAWVAGGAVGLIPFSGRLGLLIAAGVLVLLAGRAIWAASRLRGERLRGKPADGVDTAPDTAPPDPPTQRVPAPDEPPRQPPPATLAKTKALPAAPVSPAPAGRTTVRIDPLAPVPREEDEGPGYHLYRPTGSTE